MNNTPDKNAIILLETKYWDAMKTNDIESAVALTKFPCTLASPKGVQRISEEQYRKIMKANNSANYRNVEINNPQVDILNENTALISYQTEMNGVKMLDVSTWIREGTKWVCAFHSENQIQ